MDPSSASVAARHAARTSSRAGPGTARAWTAVLAAAAGVTSAPAAAMSFLPETTTSMVARSNLVFEGTVTDSWSEVVSVEHNVVVTRAMVHVTAVY